MLTKAAKRQNRRLLNDARIFIELVQNIARISKALITDKDGLTPGRTVILNNIGDILNKVTPVLDEVTVATSKLKAMHSGTPKHVRRAAVHPLKELLQEQATIQHEMMAVILDAGTEMEAEEYNALVKTDAKDAAAAENAAEDNEVADTAASDSEEVAKETTDAN